MWCIVLRVVLRVYAQSPVCFLLYHFTSAIFYIFLHLSQVIDYKWSAETHCCSHLIVASQICVWIGWMEIRVYTTNAMQCDHTECDLTECFGPCFYFTLVIKSPQANLNIRCKQNEMQETDRKTDG